MADEFRPEASVDFEAIAAMAAAEAGNGNGPHFTPPPEQAPPTAPPIRPRAAAAPTAPTPAPSGPSLGLDPFQALERIVGEQSLERMEIAELNRKLSQLQLFSLLAAGSALLLAIVIWKIAQDTG